MRSSGLFALGVSTGLAVTLVACNGGNNSTAPPRWGCPPEWVPYERGGCGPSVLLCAPDGGASADACAAAITSDAAVDPDAAPSFSRTADGTITGGWHEGTWSPLASIDCPTGWQRADDGTCDPVLRTDCPDNSAALPGGGCTHTDANACPIGAYANVASEAGSSPVLYVNATADAATADGTIAHPFVSLAAAITAAPDGAWVLLANGSYPALARPTRSIHVVGRCASSVTFTGTGTMFTAERAGLSLDLRGATLSSPPGGVYIANGASATIRDVVIRRPLGSGFNVEGNGSHLVLDNVFVDHTRLSADRHFGDGIEAGGGAVLEMRNTVVVASAQYGVNVLGGTATITDSVIRDGLDVGVIPCAIYAGGHVEVDRTVVAGNHGVSVVVPGNDAIVRDSILRGTLPIASGLGGIAIQVDTGATVTVERSLLDENTHSAVNARDEGTVVTVRDSLVRNTHPDNQSGAGVGLLSIAAASIVAERAAIDGYGVAAVTVYQGGSLSLTDVVTRNPTFATEHTTGIGIAALEGGAITARRVLVHGARSAGLMLDGVTAHADVTDSAIEDVESQFDNGVHGQCIAVQNAASLTADHVVTRRCREYGVMLSDQASAELTDLIVDSIEPSGWGNGGGVVASGQSEAQLARVSVSNVRGFGISTAVTLLDGSAVPAHIAGSDVFVHGVGQSTIRLDETSMHPAGDRVSYGLHAAQAGSLELSRVAVDETDYALFDGDGALHLTTGVLSGARTHAGARASSSSVLTLEQVSFVRNRDDDIVILSTLPMAASLPPPSGACVNAGCL